MVVLVQFFFAFQLEAFPVDPGRGPFFNDCGNVFYDCGYTSHELYYPFVVDPEPSTNPNFMLGVMFDPADFGFETYPVYITQICMNDVVDLRVIGGAPVRRFFVYPDLAGLPNDSVVLRDFYFYETGTGLAEWDFSTNPIIVNGPFWVIQRGDPTTPGGTIGIESCMMVPSAGHSFNAQGGIGDLYPAELFEDYSIHVQIEENRPTLPVPTFLPGMLMIFIALLALSALWIRRTEIGGLK